MDNRVAGGVGVCGGMTLGRVVAAADVPAFEADPQVEPRRPSGQALLAAIDDPGKPGDLDMGAMPAPDHVIPECQRTANADIARTRVA